MQGNLLECENIPCLHLRGTRVTFVETWRCVYHTDVSPPSGEDAERTERGAASEQGPGLGRCLPAAPGAEPGSRFGDASPPHRERSLCGPCPRCSADRRRPPSEQGEPCFPGPRGHYPRMQRHFGASWRPQQNTAGRHQSNLGSPAAPCSRRPAAARRVISAEHLASPGLPLLVCQRGHQGPTPQGCPEA